MLIKYFLFLTLFYLDGHISLLPAMNIVCPLVECPGYLRSLLLPLLLLRQLRCGLGLIVAHHQQSLIHPRIVSRQHFVFTISYHKSLSVQDTCYQHNIECQCTQQDISTMSSKCVVLILLFLWTFYDHNCRTCFTDTD